MDSPLWIYCIGFAAQLFFAARVMVQWYLSEKHRKVESPMLFWLFSLAGSLILLYYGWLRRDLAILIGEFISFYIYLWNLHAKGLFERIPRFVPVLVALVPVGAIALMLKDFSSFSTDFFRSRRAARLQVPFPGPVVLQRPSRGIIASARILGHFRIGLADDHCLWPDPA